LNAASVCKGFNLWHAFNSLGAREIFADIFHEKIH